MSRSVENLWEDFFFKDLLRLLEGEKLEGEELRTEEETLERAEVDEEELRAFFTGSLGRTGDESVERRCTESP